MADPSSTTSSQSSSATLAPEVLSFPHPTQAPPDTLDITNDSTPTPAPPPSTETLIDRQALFDRATNSWVPVPRGLILLPAVQDTNANTAATGNNQHAGARTRDDPSVERGNSSDGSYTEEDEEEEGAPLATSLNDDENTDQAGNTGPQHMHYGAASPSPHHAGAWFDFLHQARDALDRMESALNAPFGFDSAGNLTLFDPFADPPLPEGWNLPLGDFGPAPPAVMHQHAMENGYMHGTAPAPSHDEGAGSDLIVELTGVEMCNGHDLESDVQDEDEGDEEIWID